MKLKFIYESPRQVCVLVFVLGWPLGPIGLLFQIAKKYRIISVKEIFCNVKEIAHNSIIVKITGYKDIIFIESVLIVWYEKQSLNVYKTIFILYHNKASTAYLNIIRFFLKYANLKLRSQYAICYQILDKDLHKMKITLYLNAWIVISMIAASKILWISSR